MVVGAGDVGVRIDEVLTLVTATRAAFGGDSNGDAVGGNIFGYNGIRSDSGSFADGDRAEDLGAGTDGDVVADSGVAFGLGQDLSAEGDAVVEHDAVPNFGGFADDNAHAVVNEEATSDGGTGVDFHAGEEAGELRQDARWALDVAGPQGVRDAVHPDGVKAGVDDGVLKIAAGSGVVEARVFEVLTDCLDHLEHDSPL